MALSFDAVYNEVPFSPPKAEVYDHLNTEPFTSEKLERINQSIGKGLYQIIQNPDAFKKEFPKKVKLQKVNCSYFPSELGIGKRDLNRIEEPKIQGEKLYYYVIRENDWCPCQVELTFNQGHIADAEISPIPFIE